MSYRILHLVPGLGHGGAEHQLLLNIDRLNKEQFENHVYHLYPRTILVPELEQAGAVVHSGVVSGPFAGPRRLVKLVRTIRRIKPDLIHTSNVLAELYGGIAGKLTGVPVVGTLTNTSDPQVRLIDNPHLNKFKLRTVSAFRRALKRTHSRHIAISEHVATSAVSELKIDRSRISVIHRGIDSQVLAQSVDVSNFNLRDELAPGRFPVILNVGRLVPQKGQKYLIEAMPSIIQDCPNAMLLVAGVGFLDQRLQRLVGELSLDDHVKFLGRRDDVPALMKAADMFVFPSLYEGLGVSLLEASASAMPIIATNVGPIPEIISDQQNGVLVAPADSGAIHRAVVQLAHDSELRAELGRAARATSEQTFTIDRSVALLEDLYLQVLGNHSRAA